MHTEGILLQSTPFLDRKAIFKVFTQSLGMISLMATSRRTFSLLTPFCVAEWTLKKGANELYLLQDASLLDPLLELRQTTERLFSAGAMARALFQSQLHGRPDPKLYHLTICYLKKLLHSSHPETLAASFLLKLLLREGLFAPEKDPQDHNFSESEWQELIPLAGANRFSALEEVSLPQLLQRKIEMLFTMRMK